MDYLLNLRFKFRLGNGSLKEDHTIKRIQTNFIRLNIKTPESKCKIQKFIQLSRICFEVSEKVEEGGRARYELYGSYQGARPTKNQ
jgi:hypothetical protein